MDQVSGVFRNERIRPFLAAFCAVGWSLAYPLIKVGYAELGISQNDLGDKILFAGIRFLIAGLLVTAVCVLQRRKTVIAPKQAAPLLAFAFVNTTLHYLFSYIGLSYISGSRSTILDSMGGFLLIIWSSMVYPNDAFTWKKLMGCVLGFSGIVLIQAAPIDALLSGISFKGDGMILLNACCAAAGGMMTKRISKRMDMMAATGDSMSIGGILLILMGAGLGTTSPWNLTVKSLVVIVCLILISAICFGIYNTLLAYHPISKVAIFNALIPILGVMFSCLLLHEAFMWQYALAGGIVACSIYIINR